MRWLVCGGRDFLDRNFIFRQLSKLALEKGKPDLLISGDAAGVDKIAASWATSVDVQVSRFPADWKTYGLSAGSIRNHQMLDEGKPDLVIAFPGGRGTAHMIAIAGNAKVPTVIFTYGG